MQATAAKHLVQEHEFLSPVRAAELCSVSLARFEGWIRQGLLPAIQQNGQQLIASRDLISHLLGHNIRIPEALLQGGCKKILFISLCEQAAPELAASVVRLLFRLKEHEDFIVDFIRHGEHTELKLITFEPDQVVLLGDESETAPLATRLRTLLAPGTSIQTLPESDDAAL